MTARKTTKKAGKKTGAAAKAAPKKKAPARKAGAAKKASPTRASKASAGTKKKAAPKKAAALKSVSKPAPKPAAPLAKPAPKPDAPRAATSALNVNMGHIFALRPKANTSFRPGDLVEARQRLQDESYETLTDAARAVAEKALELTHESGARRGHKKRR